MFPTSDEDSSTPDVAADFGDGAETKFPTSDEDSSTPDTRKAMRTIAVAKSFRPLTRIHLLLT